MADGTQNKLRNSPWEKASLSDLVLLIIDLWTGLIKMLGWIRNEERHKNVLLSGMTELKSSNESEKKSEVKMEKHSPVALIEQLCEEFRNILLKWNTSILSGKIIITFGEASEPDIKFQQSVCTSHISGLPTEINQSPLPVYQHFSSHQEEQLCQTYERSSGSYVHKLSRQHCHTLQPGCCSQSSSIGEKRNAQTVDKNKTTMVITEPSLRKTELLLAIDHTVPPHCPHYTHPALSNISLPPFEKFMPMKNSHSVPIMLTDLEHRDYPDNGHDPQTCFNALASQSDVTVERSLVLSNYLADDVMDSHHGTISGSNDAPNSENNSYSLFSLDINKSMKDKVVTMTGATLEEEVTWASKKRKEIASAREFIDYNIKRSTVDLTKLNRTELIKLVEKVLQLEDGQGQELPTSLLHDRGMASQELQFDLRARESKGKTDHRPQCIPPTFSASEQSPDRFYHLLDSGQNRGKSVIDMKYSDQEKVNDAEYRLRPTSSDVDMKAVITSTVVSDCAHLSSQSKSIQNIKPLKKRTRLCTNFKNEPKSTCKSHVTEGQAMPDESKLKIPCPLPFPQDISISADQKEKVTVKSDKNFKKVSFCCKICMDNFTTRLEYRQHLRSHDGSFKCNICGKIMKTKDSLYHHQRGLHSKEKPYHCKDCNVSFNFYHSYKLHLQRHKGERPHQCKYCTKNYLTSNHLKDHVQAIHSNTCIICHICGKRFSYPRVLKIHLRRHSGEMPHKCSLCEKRFSTKEILKMHAISHIKERNFQCESCGKCFKSECSRNFHSKKHKKQSKRFMCDVCGKTFIYKCILNSHVQIHNKLRPYFCNVCNKNFKSKAAVYAHKYNVHKEGGTFSCSICSKSFKTKRCLTCHIKRHQNETIYTCSTCGATFPEKGGLSKHMKTIHLPRKCFICKICGKTGTRADNMRTHLKKHKNQMFISNNPMDFIIEELATDHLRNFQDQIVKMRQRCCEPKHRSSRKHYSTLQTSNQNSWTQPCPTAYKDVDKINARSTSFAPLVSVLPVLSTGSTTKLPNDTQMDGNSGVFNQSSKEFKSYNNLPNDQHKLSQFVSYFCQPDIPTVKNHTSTSSLNFPMGPRTTLLSTINVPREAEAPPLYSYVISPHNRNYQSTVGNFPPSDSMILVPKVVKSLNRPTFGINHEKTMATVQKVTTLDAPEPVEDS